MVIPFPEGRRRRQAAAQLDRKGPLALLKRLPDGEEVAAARNETVAEWAKNGDLMVI